MIYIIIPVFNRIHFTTRCLDSLRRQTNLDFKVIVVDDGSTDGTFDIITELYKEVDILQGDGMLFWTASINLGITNAIKSGATFILTLNNDLYVSEDFIEQLYKASAKHPNSIIGSHELDAKTKKSVYVGEKINWWTASYQSLTNLGLAKTQGTAEVTHLPGRGMLIPSKVFKKIGLFAEKALPHYMADYDFTHQAKKFGFDILICFDAKIYTYPGESGDAMNRSSKNLKNYLNHLFSIKGGGNLIDFTKYTFRNCPLIQIPSFLSLGILRRLIGYWIRN